MNLLPRLFSARMAGCHDFTRREHVYFAQRSGLGYRHQEIPDNAVRVYVFLSQDVGVLYKNAIAQPDTTFRQGQFKMITGCGVNDLCCQSRPSPHLVTSTLNMDPVNSSETSKASSKYYADLYTTRP